MGEIAHVDPDRLLVMAGDFSASAQAVGGMRWPCLDPAALPDSAVGQVVAADLIAGQVADLTASLNGWAVAARTSAEAFRHADVANGERFLPR